MLRSSTPAIVATVLSAVLPVSACAGGSAPADQPTGPAASSPAHQTPAASAEGTSSAAAAQAPSPQAGASPTVTGKVAASELPDGERPLGVLVLEPTGLGILSGSSARHLAFGTDINTLTNLLASTIGPMTRTTQPECGQGPRIQLSRNGFSVLVDGASFVGWVDSGRATPRLVTTNGISVGSTLASVKAGFAGVTVMTGSLGPEWTTPNNDLGGLLDGTSENSRMTDFYAGETCFFR